MSEETTVKLPKGVTQEQYDDAVDIIVEGFAENADADDMLSEIFDLGMKFKNVQKLYSLITKEKGLVIDPKVIGAAITEALDNVKFTFKETYGQVFDIADDIADEINGATPAKVMAKMKVKFKEQEVEFPRKPAPTRGKLGIINKTIIDVFKQNAEATEEDIKNALTAVVKTPKNAEDYAKQYHKLCYGIAQGWSALETMTHFSPDKSED